MATNRRWRLNPQLGGQTQTVTIKWDNSVGTDNYLPLPVRADLAFPVELAFQNDYTLAQGPNYFPVNDQSLPYDPTLIRFDSSLTSAALAEYDGFYARVTFKANHEVLQVAVEGLVDAGTSSTTATDIAVALSSYDSVTDTWTKGTGFPADRDLLAIYNANDGNATADGNGLFRWSEANQQWERVAESLDTTLAVIVTPLCGTYAGFPFWRAVGSNGAWGIDGGVSLVVPLATTGGAPLFTAPK